MKQQSVDVYSTVNGKYLYSFRLPPYKGHKPKEIEITNNRIIALHRNFIVVYEFNDN